jgi:hypothetical protein
MARSYPDEQGFRQCIEYMQEHAHTHIIVRE